MKVYELLADESRWTTGEMARDKDDNPVDVEDPAACKFCLMGAITKLYGQKSFFGNKEYWKLQSFVGSVARFNDKSTHEEVVALAKKADV